MRRPSFASKADNAAEGDEASGFAEESGESVLDLVLGDADVGDVLTMALRRTEEVRKAKRRGAGEGWTGEVGSNEKDEHSGEEALDTDSGASKVARSVFEDDPWRWGRGRRGEGGWRAEEAARR